MRHAKGYYFLGDPALTGRSKKSYPLAQGITFKLILNI